MKYDDIILECSGDCDTCKVLLECQYQTSSGEEKQKFLEELIARDSANESSSADEQTDLRNEPLNNASETEVIPETENEEPKTEEVSEETIKSAFEETKSEENKEETLNETVETAQAFEDETQDFEEIVTPVDKEKVDEIYAEVFGLNDLQPEQADVTEENVVEKHDFEEIVTPVDKEKVEEIYAEVFGLNDLQPEQANVTEENTVETQNFETVPEEIKETVAEEIPTETKEPKAEEVSEETIKTAFEEANPEENNEETVAEEITAVEISDRTETEDGSKEAETEQSEEPKKDVFKLVPPENNDYLLQNMCCKRGRKLIYRPSEAIITKTFTVLGTEKKNEVGEKIKDVIDAEIKQGVKAGYLDKFDGLSSSEIKEEYEDDIVYEFADQEFKKTGVIYDGKKIKVYVYDWDGKACHHVGFIDEKDAEEFIPYFIDKENYSFDVCGIITGGKGKRVVRQGDSLKIIKEKGTPIGIDADIAVLKRKD